MFWISGSNVAYLFIVTIFIRKDFKMYITEQIINEITENVVNEILNEARHKSFPTDGSVPKNLGRRPTRLKSRKRQIEGKVKQYDLMTKRYNGSIEEVLKKYASVA